MNTTTGIIIVKDKRNIVKEYYNSDLLVIENINRDTVAVKVKISGNTIGIWHKGIAGWIER